MFYGVGVHPPSIVHAMYFNGSGAYPTVRGNLTK